MKYGGKSTDVVRQKGSIITVTTVNAKGSWTRTLDTEKTLQQVSSQLSFTHALHAIPFPMLIDLACCAAISETLLSLLLANPGLYTDPDHLH